MIRAAVAFGQTPVVGEQPCPGLNVCGPWGVFCGKCRNIKNFPRACSLDLRLGGSASFPNSR